MLQRHALNSLGGALQGVRRFGEAVTALQDAVVIFRETGDRHGEGMALTNLAVVLRKNRQIRKAFAAAYAGVVIRRESSS